MTINDILQVNQIIQSQDKLPLDISYVFFQVSEAIESHLKFQQEKAQELFDKYPYTRKDNVLKFENDEAATAFAKEAEELGNFAVELKDYVKPKLRIDNRLSLSVQDIKILKDFIDFI